MVVPKPGRRVRGSETGRPIMAALDLLGRRWTLRVLWELREGELKFRALQEACGGMSPSVLNQRLRELKSGGIVANGEAGYRLTASGADLIDALRPLYAWSEGWAEQVRSKKKGRRVDAPPL